MRISLVRLDCGGNALPTAELLLPVTQLPILLKALQQVRV
jgi:hypothetical protein